ncbi:non-homologous end-joining DNA ligase LigD [Cupriavidus basilensis]
MELGWPRILPHPDRVIFDLDPGEGVSCRHVQEAAMLAQTLLGELGLAAWPSRPAAARLSTSSCRWRPSSTMTLVGSPSHAPQCCTPDEDSPTAFRGQARGAREQPQGAGCLWTTCVTAPRRPPP